VLDRWLSDQMPARRSATAKSVPQLDVVDTVELPAQTSSPSKQAEPDGTLRTRYFG
jgi:hypothetical protein